MKESWKYDTSFRKVTAWWVIALFGKLVLPHIAASELFPKSVGFFLSVHSVSQEQIKYHIGAEKHQSNFSVSDFTGRKSHRCVLMPIASRSVFNEVRQFSHRFPGRKWSEWHFWNVASICHFEFSDTTPQVTGDQFNRWFNTVLCNYGVRLEFGGNGTLGF